MLDIFVCLISAALANPFTDYRHLDSAAIRLTHSSDYTRLTKRNDSCQISSLAGPSYNAVIRPTNQNVQYCIEVHFNRIPRYLLVDTGSADTWMIASDFQCLDAAGSPVPTSACLLGDPYTGPQIPQIGNDTYYQLYGTTETFDGTFGYANVTVAGRLVQNQKVALVNRGYALGDQVRSGVFGLAPAAVGALYENENASTTPPNGTATPYKTVFESMYSDHAIGISILSRRSFRWRWSVVLREGTLRLADSHPLRCLRKTSSSLRSRVSNTSAVKDLNDTTQSSHEDSNSMV